MQAWCWSTVMTSVFVLMRGSFLLGCVTHAGWTGDSLGPQDLSVWDVGQRAGARSARRGEAEGAA